MRPVICAVVLAAALPAALVAQDARVLSAMSAGPVSVSYSATIMDWDMTVIRAGSNGWMCLPDNPTTPGVDPWCVDAAWANFLHAYMNGTEPEVDGFGLAYMLSGDSPFSNTDPTAKAPTDDNEWVEHLGGHLMILLPGGDYSGISTNAYNGGPWVMWSGTPYVHLMVPIESHGGM